LSGTVLDERSVALVRLAAAVARGGTDGALTERMRAAREAGVPRRWIEELLLQSLLNVGYPLALAAFAAWRELDGPLPAEDAGEPVEHAAWAEWARRGEAACRAVYGRTYHKLLRNLEGLHPALPPLVLIDAYGKLLARPGLDARRRELCTVAAIACLDAPRQLHAHLRGALNTGSSKEEMDALVTLLAAELPEERARRLRALWEDVRGR